MSQNPEHSSSDLLVNETFSQFMLLSSLHPGQQQAVDQAGSHSQSILNFSSAIDKLRLVNWWFLNNRNSSSAHRRANLSSPAWLSYQVIGTMSLHLTVSQLSSYMIIILIIITLHIISPWYRNILLYKNILKYLNHNQLVLYKIFYFRCFCSPSSSDSLLAAVGDTGLTTSRQWREWSGHCWVSSYSTT